METNKMTDAWFYYEQIRPHEWRAVVCYNIKPSFENNTNLIYITELTQDDFDKFGEAKSFGYLEKKYPLPEEQSNDT